MLLRLSLLGARSTWMGSAQVRNLKLNRILEKEELHVGTVVQKQFLEM